MAHRGFPWVAAAVVVVVILVVGAAAASAAPQGQADWPPLPKSMTTNPQVKACGVEMLAAHYDAAYEISLSVRTTKSQGAAIRAREYADAGRRCGVVGLARWTAWKYGQTGKTSNSKTWAALYKRVEQRAASDARGFTQQSTTTASRAKSAP